MLNDKEEKVVSYLRNPLVYVARKNIKKPEIYELSNDEILALYGKFDKYIEVEGQQRRTLGLYDEIYVIELLGVKDTLRREIEKRKITG